MSGTNPSWHHRTSTAPVPVAQWLEHCVSSAKVQFPGSTHTDNTCITWMHCKSLWIKASAKCINVNVQPLMWQNHIHYISVGGSGKLSAIKRNMNGGIHSWESDSLSKRSVLMEIIHFKTAIQSTTQSTLWSPDLKVYAWYRGTKNETLLFILKRWIFLCILYIVSVYC